MADWIIKYWLEALFGVVSLAFAASYRRLSKRLKKRQEAERSLKDGVLALLHDRLYQACSYYIAQGEIDTESLRNIEYIYNAYHELGGNGTGTTLYERVKALKINNN